MKRLLFMLPLLTALGCGNQSGKPRMEEHVGSSEVEVTGDPRVSEGAGGQGSGPTGTGGTGVSEPNVDGEPASQ